MHNRYTPWILIGIVAACWFLFGAAHWHPYSYYTMLRWAVTLTSAAVAYRLASAERLRGIWPLYAILAVLFNPLAPISLHRAQWKPIDRIAAVVLIVGGGLCVFADRKRRDTQ